MKTTALTRGVAWACALTFFMGANLGGARAAENERAPLLRVLFLGDNGPHRPADRFKQLQPELAQRRIELDYTEALTDLSAAKLAGYDGVVIYANHTRILPEQESALLDFVAAGGGFIPLHCASFCFLNSPRYIELVGAQFKSHGTGVFEETVVGSDHPIMKGLAPIRSWDETYVHTRHNSNRVVLAERRDTQGAEPWTWVREHGKGRVFYTAWGHDQRTWSQAGFHTLVERGIRWACAQSPSHLKRRAGLKAVELMEAPAPLPNYVPGARWGTQAEPIRTMQKPLAPEESMEHLVTVPGFHVSLFAAEPDVIKPIWPAWDERGRLWVAETVDYPNEMRPAGEGRDRLKICTDRDGDGRADEFKVFAGQLSVPTSFVFARGGVIVIHSGKTEFLKDTDGDDQADVREDLFTGWGTGDTHAGPSNLRYGFDHWIWGTVGYSGFRGVVGGREVRFGQGIFRFKPDGTQLEFIRSSNNNTWGLGLSEDNLVFGSTANGNASMYMPIPNRYYEAVNGWSASRLESIADSQRFYPLTEQVRQVDFHGQYTAGSGSALYTARSFPKEYWNRVQFVAEPTGHLLGKFHLEARGADFVAHNGRNFAASDDEWASPIAAEVGPDGALWVIDWYNYIIQHNPTPQGFRSGRGNAYETPLRDKIHGRIYRVKSASAVAQAVPQLPSEPRALVAALEDSNLLWRLHAQRLLIERKDRNIIPELVERVRTAKTDELGLSPGALHALWTLHGLGALADGSSPAVRAAQVALAHSSAAVRRAALMVLPSSEANAEAILRGGLLEDSDAQVRLAALLALSEMPAHEAAGAAILAMLQQSRNAEDRWIPDAATSAAARHDASFLNAVLTSFQPAQTAAPSSEARTNVAPNGSFEEQRDGRPAGWRTAAYSGRANWVSADVAHSGRHSVRISSEEGADASWSAVVAVRPRTDYRLTGWIRTEKLRKLGGARGALFNIHELQDPVRGATPGLSGDTDWTEVELTFNSGSMREVTVNCLLGGWGRAVGTAWFDDVKLTPAPGAELAGEIGRVVRLVTGHYAQRGPVDSIVAILVALQAASPALAVPVLDGLVTGWPAGKAPVLGETEKNTLSRLMGEMPESVRDRLLALAQRWGQTDLFGREFAAIMDTVRGEVANATAEASQRVAAAKRLLGLADGADAVQLVLKQVDLLTEPSLASGLISALTESRNSETARAIIAHWPRLTPAGRRAAVGALMRRADWTRALLDAVERRDLQRTDLAIEHWSQLKQNPNPMIARRAERLSAPAAGVSADRKDIVDRLLPLAKEKGDPARGAEVFAANCAVCHVFDGKGGKVGPDLTGISLRDRSDILLEILDPNRSVEANYRLWNVSTKDGEMYSGRLDAETLTTVEILDTAAQKHVIQRNTIATLDSSPVSIMPTGFEALPPEDIKGLIEFLSQPHKP